jgi:hypothetical protein
MSAAAKGAADIMSYSKKQGIKAASTTISGNRLKVIKLPLIVVDVFMSSFFIDKYVSNIHTVNSIRNSDSGKP